MSSSRSSLQAVLDRQAKPVLPGADLLPKPLERAAAPKKFSRPSREGRRLIAGHFDPKVAKQLRVLAAEGDTTVQALLEEALDLLFVKKGQGTIRGV